MPFFVLAVFTGNLSKLNSWLDVLWSCRPYFGFFGIIWDDSPGYYLLVFKTRSVDFKVLAGGSDMPMIIRSEPA